MPVVLWLQFHNVRTARRTVEHWRSFRWKNVYFCLFSSLVDWPHCDSFGQIQRQFKWHPCDHVHTDHHQFNKLSIFRTSCRQRATNHFIGSWSLGPRSSMSSTDPSWPCCFFSCLWKAVLFSAASFVAHSFSSSLLGSLGKKLPDRLGLEKLSWAGQQWLIQARTNALLCLLRRPRH